MDHEVWWSLVTALQSMVRALLGKYNTCHVYSCAYKLT
jgi:hypothetical protein